jgi:hypothetical protein
LFFFFERDILCFQPSTEGDILCFQPITEGDILCFQPITEGDVIFLQPIANVFRLQRICRFIVEIRIMSLSRSKNITMRQSWKIRTYAYNYCLQVHIQLRNDKL